MATTVSAAVLILLLASVPAPSAGQVPDAADQQTAAGTLVARLKLHAGVPQRLSLAPGVMKVTRRAGDLSWIQGPVADADLGISAGKLRVGYGRAAYGPGYTAQAALLRVWGKGSWSAPSRTWIGGEVHLTTFILDLGIGLYAPTGSAGGARFAASFGIGF